MVETEPITENVFLDVRRTAVMEGLRLGTVCVFAQDEHMNDIL